MRCWHRSARSSAGDLAADGPDTHTANRAYLEALAYTLQTCCDGALRLSRRGPPEPSAGTVGVAAGGCHARRVPTTPCPLCGAPRRARHQVRGLRYSRCGGCGATGLDPLPSPAEQEAHFGAAYFAASTEGGYADYLADAGLHRRNAAGHLRRLARQGVRAPGVLVELGAAAGYLLEQARDLGWDAVGVDVSAPMRAAAAGRGLTVVARLDDVGHAPGTVDLVVAHQVLEHVVDLPAVLAGCARLLRPGGRLDVETWDAGSLVARASGARWQQVNPPTVVWLLDRPTLVGLLQRAGFRDVTVSVGAKRVSADTVAAVLGARGGVLARWERRTRGARWRRAVLPYAAGDLVRVSAVRQ